MDSAEENDLDVFHDQEAVVEDGNEIVEVQRENGSDDENAGEKTVVKPKRVVRNPQPKLNHETLKGPRGLTALEGHFERVKFNGHGHEEGDLKMMLKTYEYWCHRLYTKFPFADCVEKIEKLGGKREVQTFVTKIRLDMLFEEKDIVDQSDEEQELPPVDIADSQLPVEPEPEITDEQLELIRLNREKAAKLRLQRIQEKASQILGEPQVLERPENVEEVSEIETTLVEEGDSPVEIEGTIVVVENGTNLSVNNEETLVIDEDRATEEVEMEENASVITN